jgi:GntR family transcriptional regulator, transcriptional repressor for pyruvate dehydrogenase complex
VFAQLCDSILRGRYRPGERLPPQRALAAELEVNLATVRQALGRLEQLRLIETRHGEATRVLDWRLNGGLEALAVLGSVDERMIGQLFEARRVLLTEAARLAAARRTDEQASALAEYAQAVANATDDDAALLADWAYMVLVAQAAGNLVFQLIMNSVRELYLPNVASFAAVVSGRGELAPLYVEAASAIRDRDPDTAAAAIARLAAEQEQRMLKRG